jgi:sulfatase maturation enzyme AslB (radical SAM superfamily)
MTVLVPTSKILCLGNNDYNTDYCVSELAQKNNSNNHGLVNDPEFVPKLPGYYHTTVVDVPWGNLFKLSQQFDIVLMLDQPREEWTHWKCLASTYKFMVELEKTGKQVLFRNNNNVKKISYWIDLLTEKNKSFCIYPWVELFVADQDVNLCARSRPTITSLDTLGPWQQDSNLNEVRQKMLAGELLPDHCRVCYEYENAGIESYRQFESLEWALQLDLSSVEDLKNIDRPYYYELNIGNNCNIKCRGCTPRWSKPIGIEAKKFNIILPPGAFSGKAMNPYVDHVDIDSLDHQSTVYFQGGEPTIMPEVATFLKQCIDKNKTNFNLSMCTNGVKLSPKFLDLVNRFSKVGFSFSLDGFGKINDYWRSGSQWDKVISNAHLLESMGHKISINTVPGIYNVTNLHLLFEFLDQEFPFTSVYMQLNFNDWQSAFNHPNTQKVLESLERCMNTSMYRSNGKSCKSSIDGLYQYYTNNPVFNVDHLQMFFDYNDQLDRAREVKLADYIPELEACRKYIL